jgi:hypothetical protein
MATSLQRVFAAGSSHMEVVRWFVVVGRSCRYQGHSLKYLADQLSVSFMLISVCVQYHAFLAQTPETPSI